MKKLLVLLLISILAIFAFAGCDGFTPAEGEGEGEGEGEIEEVTVDIAGMQQLGGKNWIAKGSHEITVTFPAPAQNVSAKITGCSGDYTKGDVVLFPNEDKTVWTGSGTFGLTDPEVKGCCASYVEIDSGECVDDVCIEIPVIVDFDAPYAQIEIGIEDDGVGTNDDPCACGGCALTFDTFVNPGECGDTECCGDDCSGLANWSIAVYEDDPFNTCCEIPCEEPIDSSSGTACPIDYTTSCILEAGDYYVLVDLVDNVGNDVRYYAKVTIDGVEDEEDCSVTVEEYCANVDASTGGEGCDCTDWLSEYDTDEYIGFCSSNDNCCYDD